MRPILWIVCGMTALPIIALHAAGDGLRYMITDHPNGPKIELWHRNPQKIWECPLWGSEPCRTVYR